MALSIKAMSPVEPEFTAHRLYAITSRTERERTAAGSRIEEEILRFVSAWETSYILTFQLHADD